MHLLTIIILFILIYCSSFDRISFFEVIIKIFFSILKISLYDRQIFNDNTINIAITKGASRKFNAYTPVLTSSREREFVSHKLTRVIMGQLREGDNRRGVIN